MAISDPKAELFRALHEGPDILIVPNAWDVASAVILDRAGFPAIGTTSAGVAYALGHPDNQRIRRDEMLEVVQRIAQGVDAPVTADMEAGYGQEPEAVAETARLTATVGAVGMNLEDGTREGTEPLFDLGFAIERIRAVREAVDALGSAFTLTARTDSFMVAGENNMDALADAVRRANAYRAAGADCLFVPGVSDRAIIERLVAEIDGPLAILAGYRTPPVPALRELGVRRVSVGSSMARATLALVRRAAEELSGPGTFSFARDAIPVSEMNQLLGG